MLNGTFSSRALKILDVTIWELEIIWGTRYPGVYLLIDDMIASLGRSKIEEYNGLVKNSKAGIEVKNSLGRAVGAQELRKLSSDFYSASQGSCGEFKTSWGDYLLSDRTVRILPVLELEAKAGFQKPGWNLLSYMEETLERSRQNTIASYEARLAKGGFPQSIDKGVSLSKAQAEEVIRRFKAAS